MLVWNGFIKGMFITYLFISLVFAYIYISQGSVKTHLPCGKIYNNRIIANCLHSAPVKEFWKLVNNRQRYWQKKSAMFFCGSRCTVKSQ